MTLIEVREFWILGWRYFGTIWNILDIVRDALCWVYLILELDDADYPITVQNSMKAMTLMLSWLRMISSFRLFKATRYLIRTLLAI